MAREIHNAIVLRRSDWRDYDRMLTLLTPEGRIEAVARGCRRPKSPLLSAAEPFTAGEYTLYKSIAHYQVEQYRSTDTFYPLREDYERLKHAAYYLKLAEMISLPDQPCQPLFDLLLRALAHITYGETAPEIVTMAFELHLLASLGLSPSMDRCVRCGVQVDSAAWFDAEGGGVVCEKCRKTLPDISNGARRIMMRVPMTRFDALSKLTGHPDAPEAARFTRRFTSLRPEMHVPSAPDIREIF